MENGQGMEITIAADPTWEPMEFGDVLDQDGVYHGTITGEKVQAGDGSKKAGVWITVELADEDVRGKKIQKFLQDPRQNEKVLFLWRGLVRSIAGIEAARQGFRYTPGTFRGQVCYFKVESYLDNQGERRSGMGAFLTADERGEYVARGKHRWPAAVAQRSAPMPTGLPASFPGLGAPPAAPPQPPAAQPVLGGGPTQGIAAAGLAPSSPFPPPAAAPPASPFANAGMVQGPSNAAPPAPPAPPVAPPPFAFPGVKR